MSEIDINKVVRKYVTGSWTAPAELVGNLCDALEMARAEVADLSLGGNAWFEERQAAVARAEKAEAQVAAVRALHQMVVSDIGAPCRSTGCDDCGTCAGCQWDVENDGPCPTIRVLDARP